MFKVGVFAIILNRKNEVLLCHRTDYDFWNLPGGKLEKEEAPWEGVIREVKEETGLNVRVDKLIGVYSKPEKDEIVFQFFCKVIGGKLILNNEADRLEYFSLNKIPQNTSPKQLERIKDYFNNLNKTNNTILKIYRGKSTIELIKEGKL